MSTELYPLKCDSVLKERLWGGNQLRDYLGKTNSSKKYGESWELASLPEGTSSIANGKFKGKQLDEMISAFAKAILGEAVVERFGPEMPLLIKFIDASKKLSVQLHPDDALAHKLHQKPNGKTEMWYVLKAQKGAYIIAGFNESMNREEFKQLLSNDILENSLNHIPVKEGDAFYISAGLIHAIGGGIVLAEIQQTSDITYRVHDYNRQQEDGSLRELHIDNACEAIKFPSLDEVFLSYDAKQEGVQKLKHCPYFNTDFVHLITTKHTINRSDSFTIVIGVKGEGVIVCENTEYPLRQGETYLIPAQCSEISIIGKELKILEVYM